MTPQVLVIGHIVKDVIPSGWRAGGGALYAAAQASRLGQNVAAVTAHHAAIEPGLLLPSVEWHRVDAGSISFENRYAPEGVRRQTVASSARPLCMADVPPKWLRAPVVLLVPVLSDVDPGLPREAVRSGGLVALGAQGWLRRLDGERVVPGEVEPAPAWLHGDAVFVSQEDVTEPEAVAAWREQVPVVVLTRGRDGYTVWDSLGRHDVRHIEGCEVDPTGAGDVFAAAFMLRFQECRDALTAARFGAAAASLAVEGEGIARIGDRAAIEARLLNVAEAGA